MSTANVRSTRGYTKPFSHSPHQTYEVYDGTQRYSGDTTLFITDLWETIQTDSAEKKLKVQQKKQ